MKNVLIGILVVVVVIAAFCALGFGLGWFNVAYTNTVGVAQANANHEVFKEGKAYVEGMIQELANFKLELAKETDPAVRNAIVETIVSRFANFDINEIEDIGLQNFLRDCRNGEVK